MLQKAILLNNFMNKISLNKFKKSIINNLEDSKAQDVVTIALKDKSDACDFMIVTSGTSDRHVAAIAEKLVKFLKHECNEEISYQTEGINEGKWVLIDAGQIVVHIFIPEMRDFYNLEALWS